MEEITYNKGVLASFIRTDSKHDGMKGIEKALYNNCVEISSKIDENKFLERYCNLKYDSGIFNFIEGDSIDNQYKLFNLALNDDNILIFEKGEEGKDELNAVLTSINNPINLVIDFAFSRLVNKLFKIYPYTHFNIIRNVFTDFDPAQKPIIINNIGKGEALESGSSEGLIKLINKDDTTSIVGIINNIDNKKLYTIRRNPNLFDCHKPIDNQANFENTIQLDTPLQLSAINLEQNIGMIGGKAFLTLTNPNTQDITIYDSKSAAKSGFDAFQLLSIDDIKNIKAFIVTDNNSGINGIIETKKTDTTNAVAKYLGDTNQVLSTILSKPIVQPEETNGIITHDRLLVAKSILSGVPFILFCNATYNRISIFINNGILSDDIRNKQIINSVLQQVLKSIIQQKILSQMIPIILNKANEIFVIGIDKITTLNKTINTLTNSSEDIIESFAVYNSINNIYKDLVALSYAYYEILLYLKTILYT